MPTDYRTETVTLAVGATPTLLFMGRSARRTLVVSAGATGVTFVGVGEGDFSNRVFARVPSGQTLVMPLRDFGPLITGEIWVTCTINGNTISGAEIFDVGKARR